MVMMFRIRGICAHCPVFTIAEQHRCAGWQTPASFEEVFVPVTDVPVSLSVYPATDEVFVGTYNGALALLDTQHACDGEV